MSLPSAAGLLAETENTAEDTPHLSGRFEGEQILVPLVTASGPVLRDQLRVAASLARTTEATLYVVDPSAPTEGMTTVFTSELRADGDERLLALGDQMVSDPAVLGSRFLHSRRIVNRLLETIKTNDIDTLVVPSASAADLLRQGFGERLSIRADCDVVTVNGRPGYDGVPSILLAVSGGPHSGLATDVAGHVAADCNAWVDVLHVLPADAPSHRREVAEDHVKRAARRIGRPDCTSTWVLEAPAVADAIIEQSRYYGLTVVGAPTQGRLQKFIGQSTNRSIRDNAESTVLSVRHRT